jgi:hypothetical protein
MRNNTVQHDILQDHTSRHSKPVGTCFSREEIYDLLRPNSGSLNLREDIRKGVYVEGLVEKVVDNSECLAAAAAAAL